MASMHLHFFLLLIAALGVLQIFAEVSLDCPASVPRVAFASLTAKRLHLARGKGTPLIITGAFESSPRWRTLAANGGAGMLVKIGEQRNGGAACEPVDFWSRAVGMMRSGQYACSSRRPMCDAVDPKTGKWKLETSSQGWSESSQSITETDMFYEGGVTAPLSDEDLGALFAGASDADEDDPLVVSSPTRWVLTFGVGESGEGMTAVGEKWLALLPRAVGESDAFGKIWYWWPRRKAIPDEVYATAHLDEPSSVIDARLVAQEEARMKEVSKKKKDRKTKGGSGMVRCAQRPGEILWLPNQFAHTTLNVDNSNDDNGRGLIVGIGAFHALPNGLRRTRGDLLAAIDTMIEAARAGKRSKFDRKLSYILRVQPLLLADYQVLVEVMHALREGFRDVVAAHRTLDAFLVATRAMTITENGSSHEVERLLKARCLTAAADAYIEGLVDVEAGIPLHVEAAGVDQFCSANHRLAQLSYKAADWENATKWSAHFLKAFPLDQNVIIYDQMMRKERQKISDQNAFPGAEGLQEVEIKHDGVFQPLAAPEDL